MKILFIDASITELKKNYLKIADFFKERDSSLSAIFMTVDTASFVVPSMETDANKTILNGGYSVERFKSFNRNKIRRRLKSNRPDIVFIDAMNVGNQLWNAICKEESIPVYFYPHGFQIDNIFYRKSELLGKLVKVCRYIYGLYNISKVTNKSFFKIYKAYSNYISSGADMKGTEIDDPRLYPNVVFLTSDYYKDFWERKYGIRNVRYEYIMPYDFAMVESVLAKPQEDAVCYITQTLHEDGRYTKEEHYHLLRDLRAVASVTNKLYIKLHPRVDSGFYEKAFEGLENVTICRDFPYCKIYFTHYSAMAYLSALICGKTIIYELPGQPTHEVFKEVASELVYDVPHLTQSIERLEKTPELPFEERKKIISKFATYTGESPYEVLYRTIYKS